MAMVHFDITAPPPPTAFRVLYLRQPIKHDKQLFVGGTNTADGAGRTPTGDTRATKSRLSDRQVVLSDIVYGSGKIFRLGF